MKHKFEEIFNEHKTKHIPREELMKKMLRIFYNARDEYLSEFAIAEKEYEEEIESREHDNDANDIYKHYEELGQPEYIAREKIYMKYFGYIDPDNRYSKSNKKIFDIMDKVMSEIEQKEKEKEDQERDLVELEKAFYQQQQEEAAERLLKQLNKEHTEEDSDLPF